MKLWQNFLVICVCVVFVPERTFEQSVDSTAIRWCTISAGEQDKCHAMRAAFHSETSLKSPDIICVQKNEPQQCVDAIGKGLADLVTLDGGDIYTGGKKHAIRPIMEEIYMEGVQGYSGVAVVRKTNTNVNLNNLRGKKTCHTGYGRTAGWNLPIGYLLEERLMPSTGCKEPAQSAAAFFSQSCVPGVEDAVSTSDNVSNLCALCGGDCSRQSIYSGYSGAFRCLIEQNADVAFIKPVTVTENTDNNKPDEAWTVGLNSADFEILCPDGSRNTLANHETCHFAKSPSHAVVTSSAKSDEEISRYQDLLKAAQEVFSSDKNKDFTMFDSEAWNGADLLFKDSTSSLSALSTQTYELFLGDYFKSLEGLLQCPPDTYRFCTTSEEEQAKCKQLATAIQGQQSLTEYGVLSCFPANNHLECVEYIDDDNADLVTLDGGDLYTAGKDFGLIPILSENYGTGDASYWAVAVVKAGTGFTINDLKGKKSCHTGIMKTSGWIIPVGYLINSGQITLADGSCDVPAAVGEFFGGSCVPGAKQASYDPGASNPESLCSLCSGIGSDNCVRSSAEPYYDYSGALKCLVDDAGEVAFVKHATVPAYLAENPSEAESDYELLCPDGTRKPVSEYLQCNLAKVSSHAVVTDGEKALADVENMQQLLHKAGMVFSDAGSNFQIFNSENFAGRNLLFKDSTESLINVKSKKTYDTYLSSEYIKDINALQCNNDGALSGSHILVILFAIVGVVLQQLMADV